MNPSDSTSDNKRKAEEKSAPPSAKKRTVFLVYDDKDKALAAVRQNGLYLSNRSERLQDDEEVVRAAIRQNPQALIHASERLRGDLEIVKAAITHPAITHRPENIRCASLALLHNRDAVLSLVQTNARCFEYLVTRNEKWKDDKELVLAATDGDTYQASFASCRLKGDRDVLLAAAEGTWLVSVVTRASLDPYFKENPQLLESILHDREIMVKAVRNHGSYLLRFLPEEFQSDREFAVAAIGMGIQRDYFYCLSEELTEDRELNLLAAQKFGYILDIPKFNADREIMLAAVTRTGLYWSKASEDLQFDRDIAQAAVRSDGSVYGMLPESLKSDREIGLAAVSRGSPEQLPELPIELRGDWDIVWAALEGYDRDDECGSFEEPPDWFHSASTELRSHPELMLEAVERNGLFLRDVILGPGDRDLQIVKSALQQDVGALSFVPDRLRNHPEVAAAAIRAPKPNGYELEEEQGLVYVRVNVGQDLIQKLNAIYDEYKLEVTNSDQIQLSEHKDVKKWSKEWKQRLWHKAWIVRAATMTAIPKDARDTILRFSDILPDFRLARKISDVAPVVEALAEMDMGVNDFLNVS